MNNIEIVLNKSGFMELLKSQEIQDELLSRANEIANRCDGIYDTNVYVGKTRANASIITHDWKTYYRNLKDNELLKALK